MFTDNDRLRLDLYNYYRKFVPNSFNNFWDVKESICRIIKFDEFGELIWKN